MLKSGFVADNLEALAKVAAHTGSVRRGGRFRRRGSRHLQRRRHLCQRRGARHVPQAPAAELRRLRRGALLHPRSANDPLRAVRRSAVCKVGRQHLRGRVEPDRAARRAGGRWRRAQSSTSTARRTTSTRSRTARTHAGHSGGRRKSCALVYVNQVCGQDELVFDGGSMVFDAEGTLVARAAQFVEELLITEVHIEPVYRKRLLDPRGRRTEIEMPLIPTSPMQSTRAATHAGPRPDRAHAGPALPSCTRRWSSARGDYLAQERLHRRGASACPVESTPRWWPASPSTRSAPITSTACRCRRATRATARRPTPPTWPRTRDRLPHDRHRAGVQSRSST